MGQVICLTLIVFTAGCSDAEKRAAGRNLQQATSEACRLYEKASSILSNPVIVGENGGKTVQTDTLSVEALKLLDQAEKTLTTALQENYDNRKSDIESVPQGDVAIAKMTLGMVRNLRAQYYIWSTEKTLKAATGSLDAALAGLVETESADSVVFSFEQRIKNSNESVKELNSKADSIEKEKADLVQKKTAVDSQIKTHQDEIAQLEKTITADSAKASALHKESTLTTGDKSLEKLEAALKIEEGVHANRFKIKDIEDKIKVLTGQADFYQYQIAQADHKLAEIDKKRKAWEVKASQDSEYLANETKKVEALLKSVADLQKSTGEACKKALQMSNNAILALAKAENDFSQAGKLESNKKAEIISEGGRASENGAMLQITLWDMNRRLTQFSNRAEAVWGTLHVDKPAEAVDVNLKEFIDKTKDSAAAAVAYAKAAVSSQEKALKSGDSDRRWYFQRDIAGAYIAYSQALEISGKEPEARDVLGKASELLIDIERQAKAAGEYPSILKLKELIEKASRKAS